MVAEASRAQRHMMVHGHGARGAEMATRAGARSIEHGFRLDQEAVGVLADTGMWLVSTLLASQTAVEPEPAWLAEAREFSGTSVPMGGVGGCAGCHGH